MPNLSFKTHTLLIFSLISIITYADFLGTRNLQTTTDNIRTVVPSQGFCVKTGKILSYGATVLEPDTYSDFTRIRVRVNSRAKKQLWKVQQLPDNRKVFINAEYNKALRFNADTSPLAMGPYDYTSGYQWFNSYQYSKDRSLQVIENFQDSGFRLIVEDSNYADGSTVLYSSASREVYSHHLFDFMPDSLGCSEKCVITYYDSPNLSNKKLVTYGSVYEMPNEWDNRARSMNVSPDCQVVLFPKTHFGGQGTLFSSGAFNSLGNLDLKVSSALLISDEDCIAFGYADMNGSGDIFLFAGDVGSIPAEFNDRMTSIKINNANCVAVLYSDGYFGGAQKIISGTTDLVDLSGDFNDRTSSIKLFDTRKVCYAQVFETGYYAGKYRYYTGITNLPADFNDIISSVKLSDPKCRVILFEDGDRKGNSYAINADTPDIVNMNDKASSLVVLDTTRDCVLEAWSETNYQGSYYAQSVDINFISNFNDMIKSFKLSPNCVVAFFPDSDYIGTPQIYSANTPTMSTYNSWASSFQLVNIANACYVILYKDGYYGGDYLFFKQASDVMPDGWNDQVSSIKISPGCRFDAYSDGNKVGIMKTYYENTVNLLDFNDVISSFDLYR